MNKQLNNETANGNTMAIVEGLKFTRKSDKAKGVVVKNDKGDFAIRFNHPTNGHLCNCPISDKWILDAVLEEVKPQNTENLLEEVLENSKTAKGKRKTPSAPSAPSAPAPTSEVKEVLNDNENLLRIELELEFAELDEKEKAANDTIAKTPFSKAKIIEKIRRLKLFRSTHKTFQDYAVEVLKIDRTYASNMAQIGEFALIAEEFFTRDNLALSVRSVNQFIRNNNKLRDDVLNMPKNTPLSDFQDVLDNVISITGEIAKKEGESITELTSKTVDAVNDQITSELGKLSTYSGKDILQKANKILTDKRAKIIKSAQKALSAPTSNALECPNKTHIQKIKSFVNNIITLECGCTFKQFAS